MFEEGMSSNELLDEYRLDLADIQEKTVRFDNSEYVTRYLWKRHKQPTVILTKVLLKGKLSINDDSLPRFVVTAISEYSSTFRLAPANLRNGIGHHSISV